jgi:prophage antirepressor-like protein
MQYTLQIFEYEGHNPFRMTDRDGEPWFVLADVCRVLGIGNPSDAARRLDDDEKDTLDNVEGIASARVQSLTVINESGLYSLILTSRKEGAKKFKKWVTAEVLPSIRKTGGYRIKPVPAFILRYNENWDRVEQGYFSVISELAIRLWGRFEQVGYVMADRALNGAELRPDVSVGKRFADWLGKSHPGVCDNFKSYMHKTPEGEFQARQYPNSMLPLYIEFVDEHWVPECAESYFKSRDPAALPHLPKLLPSRPANSRLPKRRAS